MIISKFDNHHIKRQFKKKFVSKVFKWNFENLVKYEWCQVKGDEW